MSYREYDQEQLDEAAWHADGQAEHIRRLESELQETRQLLAESRTALDRLQAALGVVEFDVPVRMGATP